jgi:hypothetical protein
MADDVARAVGAGSPAFTVNIGGRECTPRPLGIRELTEVERDCLERYKRSYLETFSKNLDLVPEDRRDALLEKKMDEVARWDIDSLPTKMAYSSKGIILSDSLRIWLAEHWAITEDQKVDDIRLCRLAAASMDQESLSPEEYKRMTGSKPPQYRVPYVHWWITGNYDGMITLIWICFSANGVTREQIVDSVGKDAKTLNETAREVEKLSAPQSGNG